MEPVKIIESGVPGIVAHIYSDLDPEPPENDIVKIAYLNRSRYTLGDEAVSEERMDEIGQQVREGKLVGVPVWAYVHSGATISTGKKLKGGKGVLRMNPFNCPWDSARSGWAYMKREDALREWGNKRLSEKQRQKAEFYIDGVVDEFDMYLRGECYGIVVMDVRDGQKELESCWGFYGWDYTEAEAARMAQELAAAEKAPAEQLELDLSY